jgi:hypothetical protein
LTLGRLGATVIAVGQEEVFRTRTGAKGRGAKAHTDWKGEPMKGKVVLAVACLLAASWIATTPLSAGDNSSKDQPGLQSVANGPKDSPPGWERIVFVHYRRGYGKPEEPPGKKPPGGGLSCYGFIARGAKWQTLPVNYSVGCANRSNLPPEFLYNAVSAAASAWDDETGEALFNPPTMEESLTINTAEADNDHNIVFADLSASHAIAITYVWGRFGGPADQRKIVDFDMILDDGDYAWGDPETAAIPVMDVQNIVTHELGHALGLNDVYQSACSNVTMYGYSDYDETSKRTLEQPDITGLQELYGQ